MNDAIRVRATYRNWSMNLRIQYDANQLTEADVINLLARTGVQIGLGEFRPDPTCHAMCGGFGTFKVEAKQ